MVRISGAAGRSRKPPSCTEWLLLWTSLPKSCTLHIVGEWGLLSRPPFLWPLVIYPAREGEAVQCICPKSHLLQFAQRGCFFLILTEAPWCWWQRSHLCSSTQLPVGQRLGSQRNTWDNPVRKIWKLSLRNRSMERA